MTVTIVPANPGFFVIHARPGETAPYEIFSRLSIIAWRIDDESHWPMGRCDSALLLPHGNRRCLIGSIDDRIWPHGYPLPRPLQAEQADPISGLVCPGVR
jgi:hypothetical protein